MTKKCAAWNFLCNIFTVYAVYSHRLVLNTLRVLLNIYNTN